jgi:hypothetical protein
MTEKAARLAKLMEKYLPHFFAQILYIYILFMRYNVIRLDVDLEVNMKLIYYR